MDPAEFPPNSRKAKEAKIPVEKPPVEQIVSGGVIRKKSLSRRFKDVFLGGDFKTAREYVAYDVLVPSLQDLLFNVITKGSERIIYRMTGRQINARSGIFAPRIQFNTPVRRDPREIQGIFSPQAPQTHSNTKQRADLGELILGSREEAQLIVEALMEFIEQYDVATFGDLKGLLGFENIPFTDEQWGWTNLSDVQIKHISQGYLVELPAPEPIQR